jgi:nucleotide-binding universal stress UspA family protein
MTTIRTILVPVDFTPGSLAAVAYARDLAAIFSSRVHLLHVATGAPSWAADLFAAHARRLHGHDPMQSLDQLATLIASLRFDPCTTTGVVRMGCVDQAIGSYAAEVHADLIVMGTHGSHAAPGEGVCRVVERVLSCVHCPVLTIPDPLLEEAICHRGPRPLEEAMAC